MNASATGTLATSYCGTWHQYDINEEEYAIVKNSGVSWWCSRQHVNEHTLNGIGNSGAMLVNASSNTNQIFYELPLTGLCPGTKYEFSAWYVSLANSGESPSNITFQIYQKVNNVLTWVDEGNTGDFGGSSDVSSFVWYQKVIEFTTPSGFDPLTTSYVLRLKNNNNATLGNDLMIDDIVVRKCISIVYTYMAGTNQTAVSVCSNDSIQLEVFLPQSALDLVKGSSIGSTIYIQWMVSNDSVTWTTLGLPIAYNGSNNFFTIIPPTINVHKYYRAKVSIDSIRAAAIHANASQCFNDVITQVFDLYRHDDLLVLTEPSVSPFYICQGEVVISQLLKGSPPSGSQYCWIKEELGLVYDTIGTNWKTYPDDTTMTATTTGTYIFCVRQGICSATKNVVIKISELPVITPVNIDQPDPVCEGDTLTLTTPAVSSTHLPILKEGWLLNGVEINPSTRILTVADNGKKLTYFAMNACDTVYSDTVQIVVNAKVVLTLSGKDIIYEGSMPDSTIVTATIEIPSTVPVNVPLIISGGVFNTDYRLDSAGVHLSEAKIVIKAGDTFSTITLHVIADVDCQDDTLKIYADTSLKCSNYDTLYVHIIDETKISFHLQFPQPVCTFNDSVELIINQFIPNALPEAQFNVWVDSMSGMPLSKKSGGKIPAGAVGQHIIFVSNGEEGCIVSRKLNVVR
jgi:hypothetical protein